MRQVKHIMGMPISAELTQGDEEDFRALWRWFETVDRELSPYKPGQLDQHRQGRPTAWTQELEMLCERVREQTNGYFDPYYNGTWDPTGLTKGWAISRAGTLLEERGLNRWALNVGGDILVRSDREPWQLGIENPLDPSSILTVVEIDNGALATSAFYARGEHVKSIHKDLVGVSVLGESVTLADAYATALLSAGAEEGLKISSKLRGYAGLMMRADGEVSTWQTPW